MWWATPEPEKPNGEITKEGSELSKGISEDFNVDRAQLSQTGIDLNYLKVGDDISPVKNVADRSVRSPKGDGRDAIDHQTSIDYLPKTKDGQLKDHVVTQDIRSHLPCFPISQRGGENNAVEDSKDPASLRFRVVL